MARSRADIEREATTLEVLLADSNRELAEGTQRVRAENDKQLKSMYAASLLSLKKDIDVKTEQLRKLRLILEQMHASPPYADRAAVLAQDVSSPPAPQQIDTDLALALRLSEEEEARTRAADGGRRLAAQNSFEIPPESFTPERKISVASTGGEDDEEMLAAKIASISALEERPVTPRPHSPDEDEAIKEAKIASLRDAMGRDAVRVGAARPQRAVNNSSMNLARALERPAAVEDAKSIEQRKAQLVSLLLAASERYEELDKLQKTNPSVKLPVLDDYAHNLAAARSVEAYAARNLREEQERSYAESLAKDQEREREETRKVAAEAADEQRVQLEKEELQHRELLVGKEKEREELARNARMSVLASLFPPAPVAAVAHSQASATPLAVSLPVAPADSTLIRLRLPDGTHAREFPLSAPLASVSFLAEQLLLAAGYALGTKPVLSAGFPPKPFTDEDVGRSLRELGLKGATVVVAVRSV